jgi:hypothetical protein
MNFRFAVLLSATLLVCGEGFAQESSTVELTGFYSYFRFNPENSGMVTSNSLNGGGVEATLFFTKMFGMKGELAGYGSHTINYTNGAVSAAVRANLFTYTLGPILKFRVWKVEPFGEALFGGAHSSFYGNLCKVYTGCTANNPSNNAFDFILGGGLDIPLSKSIAFRPAQVDYVLTRFGNGFTSGNQNQSNFRYQIGIQFRF